MGMSYMTASGLGVATLTHSDPSQSLPHIKGSSQASDSCSSPLPGQLRISQAPLPTPHGLHRGPLPAPCSPSLRIGSGLRRTIALLLPLPGSRRSLPDPPLRLALRRQLCLLSCPGCALRLHTEQRGGAAVVSSLCSGVRCQHWRQAVGYAATSAKAFLSWHVPGALMCGMCLAANQSQPLRAHLRVPCCAFSACSNIGGV